jgi:probable non-F420 flavinoid oxidoreductase
MLIGFHASHEQFRPSRLLDLVRAAEVAGFDAAMCSDHFAPWSERQGHSGFAWSWLGAALERTSFSIGVVTAPGQRYHPAVTAQSVATLAEMFPGRFWAALGSGEAMNEHITGDRWPSKAERIERLLECVAVIDALLDGDEVTHSGRVVVDRARLWTRPTTRPALFGAAVSESTARLVAGWADGLITVGQPLDDVQRVVAAFRDGGGEHKPVCVQVHLSFAETDRAAEEIALEHWATNALPSEVAWNLELPEHFDALAPYVSPSQVRRCVFTSASLQRHVEHLVALGGLGVDRVYLHHVGPDQEAFIDAFAAHVLPAVRQSVGEPS